MKIAIIVILSIGWIIDHHLYKHRRQRLKREITGLNHSNLLLRVKLSNVKRKS